MRRLVKHMLRSLAHCHLNGVVSCDIKPENFLIGVEENEDKIYLLDYGLSKKFRSSSTSMTLSHAPGRCSGGSPCNPFNVQTKSGVTAWSRFATLRSAFTRIRADRSGSREPPTRCWCW